METRGVRSEERVRRIEQEILCGDFMPILRQQLIVEIMKDGRWWTATALRKRLRWQKGTITYGLDALRKKGHVRRAKNPTRLNEPFYQSPKAIYVYQWTGKEYTVTAATCPWHNAPYPKGKQAREFWPIFVLQMLM
jgi:hypothetical protein